MNLDRAVMAFAGVMILISDFLDPVESYSGKLKQLARTHRIILVDVATPLDRSFPIAKRWEINAQSLPLWEGARHLEKQPHPLAVSARTAREWNSEQAANLEQLTDLERPKLIRRIAVGDSDKVAAPLQMEQAAIAALEHLS